MSGKVGTGHKDLIEKDLVECIVAMPGQLFFTTQIPVCLWFLTKDKSDRTVASERQQRMRTGEVLFIDARQLGTMVSRTNKELTDADIAHIAGTFHAWRGEEGEYKDVPGFCASVTLDQITEHGHVLTPGRYVGSEVIEDDGEPLSEKIERLIGEVHEGFDSRIDLQTRVVSALRSLKESSFD